MNIDRLLRGAAVMPRMLLGTLVVIAASGFASLATELDVSIEAQGCQSSTLTIGPGCETPYHVFAELSDTASDGLALIVFDLEFDGGLLPQVDTPVELPMQAFAPPAGLSNPGGFGGTSIGGRLVQVGGAQNVLVHGWWDCETDDDCPEPSSCVDQLCSAVPGLPLGTVVVGVGQAGFPVKAATGTLTTPAAPGDYTLRLTNLTANVIEKGAFGLPFWQNEPAGIGTNEDLAITVVDGAACCDVYETCCMPGGSCTGEPPEVCDALGGVLQGPDVVCERDLDGDGVDGICGDLCPNDPDKIDPGVCGCGVSDDDTDGDTVPDCLDECPGEDDLQDDDQNGIPDCLQPPSEPVPAIGAWGSAILAVSLLLLSMRYWKRRGEARSRLDRA